jgi:hypothetical protein
MFRHVLSFIGVASTCSLFAFAAPVQASAHAITYHESAQQQPSAMRQSALQHTASPTCAPVVVQPGDTLSQIATKHHVTWPYLATLNHILNPNLIFPEQVFQVCGATPATPSAPSHAPVAHKATAPAPHVASHAAPEVGSGSVQGMIRSVFGAYANQALAIAACESGYNPGATNRSSGAAGVFQFLRSTWAHTPYAGSSPYNAGANIQAAHWLFARDGYSWREWSCRP